ncbi:hypothetical protein NJ76_21130 [Rhodococcus sp. IITR03]|nr:hypothetical protein NJ76_21130 [Rhodococcus sp. IITR03]
MGRREGGFLDDLPVLLRNTGRRPIEQLDTDTDTDRAVGDAGTERDSTVTDIDQGALREWIECVDRGVAEDELVMVDRDHAVGLHPAIIPYRTLPRRMSCFVRRGSGGHGRDRGPRPGRSHLRRRRPLCGGRADQRST